MFEVYDKTSGKPELFKKSKTIEEAFYHAYGIGSFIIKNTNNNLLRINFEISNTLIYMYDIKFYEVITFSLTSKQIDKFKKLLQGGIKNNAKFKK